MLVLVALLLGAREIPAAMDPAAMPNYRVLRPNLDQERPPRGRASRGLRHLLDLLTLTSAFTKAFPPHAGPIFQ